MDTITVRITTTSGGFDRFDDLMHRSGLTFEQFVMFAVETHIELARCVAEGEDLYMGNMTELECRLHMFGIHMPSTQSQSLIGVRPAGPTNRSVRLSRAWYSAQTRALEVDHQPGEISEEDVRLAFCLALKNYAFLLGHVLNGKWLYIGKGPLENYKLPGYLPFRATAF